MATIFICLSGVAKQRNSKIKKKENTKTPATNIEKPENKNQGYDSIKY